MAALIFSLLCLLGGCMASFDMMAHMGEQWYIYQRGEHDLVLFKIFQDFPRSFADAEENCREYNAHLASFHSADELSFIYEIQLEDPPHYAEYSYIWLGLFADPHAHRGANSTNLRFTDQTPATYAHQVVNLSRTSECLAMMVYEQQRGDDWF